MTLHLTLTALWYDLIRQDMKTVEYRALTPFWQKRITKLVAGDTLVFHRGYTATTIRATVTAWDIGVCPYVGWEGEYYRVAFVKEAK